MAESSYYSKGEKMAWDDREIIAQFLCRDEAAIKNTADKYERYCSSIAYRILGNGEDVRECLNDTWLKLWESIPPTVPEILSAYVGKITRNLAINRYDHLHAGKRCGDSVDQPLEELKECASLAHDNVREEMDRKDLEEAINRYLDGLPSKKRQIFVRRYFYLDEIYQIAEHFHMTESAVKVGLHRMRKSLKIHLQKEGYHI